jgi:hypothetical protein
VHSTLRRGCLTVLGTSRRKQHPQALTAGASQIGSRMWPVGADYIELSTSAAPGGPPPNVKAKSAKVGKALMTFDLSQLISTAPCGTSRASQKRGAGNLQQTGRRAGPQLHARIGGVGDGDAVHGGGVNVDARFERPQG